MTTPLPAWLTEAKEIDARNRTAIRARVLKLLLQEAEGMLDADDLRRGLLMIATGH